MTMYRLKRLSLFILVGIVSSVSLTAGGAHAATLPVAATDVARDWDSIYWFLMWVSAFFFVGIVVAMAIFAIKYRKGVNKRPKYLHGHTGIEVLWTIIPTIIVLWMFWWGWLVYKDMVHAPQDAMEIHVIGKQWQWQFVYNNGKSTVGDLYVPANKPVKLIMSSEDVLHSFFVPNFRVKQDVVPGMYTHVWFEAKIPGIHQIYCTEYCGGLHSGMLARMIVLTPEQWHNFQLGKEIDLKTLAPDPTFPGYETLNNVMMLDRQSKIAAAEAPKNTGGQLSLADKGKALMAAKGCIACHTTDGSKLVGPSYKGIYGADVKLADGRTVKADDNYIRESIENPTAKVVEGFPPSMPPYKGLMSEEEILSMIEFIKSLK
ncbi:MAG: cytochrome c oxidase subunit II [Bdellovibrionales bacterium]|nr:cytochrome c oxidase subunit II [Bdellovibrionales bacterium]